MQSTSSLQLVKSFFIIMQKTIWLLRTSLDACCHLLLSIFVQALEQLGSSFDPTFTMGMPAFQPCTSQPDSHPNGGTWRPFDLNCATYNQLAAAAAAASSPLSANASSNSGSPSHITGWPRASSSMCFPDHAQEQFCHWFSYCLTSGQRDMNPWTQQTLDSQPLGSTLGLINPLIEIRPPKLQSVMWASLYLSEKSFSTQSFWDFFHLPPQAQTLLVPYRSSSLNPVG